MVEVSGRVTKFSPGHIRTPGVQLDGKSRYYNAPKDSRLLTEDLENQDVTLTLEEVYGDRVEWVTEVRTERGDIRRLNRKTDFATLNVEVNAKVSASEWFHFYQQLCDKLVPKGITDSYHIEEKERNAVLAANVLWLRWKEEQFKLASKSC